MTVEVSSSFNSLIAGTLNTTALDNALGGSGSYTWGSTGFGAAPSGGQKISGDSAGARAQFLYTTAGSRKARIKFDPNGGTSSIQVWGNRDGSGVSNYLLALLGTNHTTLRIREGVSQEVPEGADRGTIATITAPGATFWLQLEINGLVVTVRVLNNDLSVRNEVSHTFTSIPTGTRWGFGFANSGFTGFFDDWIIEDLAAADTLAPTLTTPTATALSDTTASGTVSTNESNGTLYHLTTASDTATATEVKAGASQVVTATGTQTVSITGLTASTAYYTHYLHRDAAGNDSAVSTTAQYTTAAPPVTLTTNRMTNNNNSILWANETGVTLHIYDVATGDKVATKTGQTSDAAGILTVTDGSLVAGTAYRYVVVLASGAEGLDTVTAA